MNREPYNYYREQEKRNTDERAKMYAAMERYWNSQYNRDPNKIVSH